ncbi:MAG: hypothetical protein V1908_03700 [Candidatus Peregrinibacteria bacterium]
MLKALFSSNTRVKLLHTFLLNPDEEYFIRELTRKLDEQINSIRRELDNLKKIGLLRSKMRNRKKYYLLNHDFPIFQELRSIFLKGSNTDDELVNKLLQLSDIELLVLHGAFIGKDAAVDLLVVGNVDKTELQNILSTATKPKSDLKFALMTRKEFLYRLECKDKFVHQILGDPSSLIPLNKLKKELERVRL